MLQIASSILCAFSAFAVSGQSHPFDHQCVALLPVIVMCSWSLARKTVFNQISFQYTFEGPYLSTLFPLFTLQCRESSGVFLHYLSKSPMCFGRADCTIASINITMNLCPGTLSCNLYIPLQQDVKISVLELVVCSSLKGILLFYILLMILMYNCIIHHNFIFEDPNWALKA